MRIHAVFGLISLGLLGACAQGRPPELAAATSAIHAAEVAGAGKDARASLYLRCAESELARAKDRLSFGDVDAARGLAMQAEADAELARVMTHELRARDEAQRVSREVEELRDELNAANEAPPREEKTAGLSGAERASRR